MNSFRTDMKRLFALDNRLGRETDEFLDRLKTERVTKKLATRSIVHKTIAHNRTRGLDFVLSDQTPDRYDDIIMASGWRLENFRRNPIALFHHASSFPIGRWKNVRVEDNSLQGTLVLAPEGTSDRIDELRRLVDEGILRAVSVGFTPLKSEERKGDTYGLVYTEQELVECSLVSVPANPNALQIAKELKISADTRQMVFGGADSTYYTAKQVNGLIEDLLGSVDEVIRHEISEAVAKLKKERR